jgi:peptidoglycan/LPS O-acetylase OafA/YrhL
MRGVAALMVMLVHAVWPIPPVRSTLLASVLDSVGPAGVDLFFVISGFIIATVASFDGLGASSRGRWRVARDFAIKRAIRIYPIYWIVFAAASLILVVAPLVSLHPDWIKHRNPALLLLLAALPNDRILAAWTLVYEVYFYAVAAVVVLLAPRHITGGLMIWFGGVGIAIAAGFAMGGTWIHHPVFSALIFEFMFGVVIALLLKRGVHAYGIQVLLLGGVSLLAGAYIVRLTGGWIPLTPWARAFFLGLPSALIIYGALALELSRIWLMPRWLQRVGDASYALYLTHQLLFAVMSAVCIYFGVFGNSGYAWFCVFAATGIGFGVLIHHRIEAPLHRWLGRLLLHRRVPTQSLTLPPQQVDRFAA